MTQDNSNRKERWKDLEIKEKLAYSTAIGLIISGVVIAFLSFFLNEYDIETGMLIYIAQAFVVGGSLLGAQAYFKSKWIEFNTNAQNDIKRYVDQAIRQERLEG